MAFGNHIAMDLRFLGQGSDDNFTSRLWWRIAGSTPLVGNLQVYTNEIMEHMQVEMAAVLPEGHFFAGVNAKWQLGSDEHFVVSSSPAVEGAVSSTESLPEYDSIILRRYTGDSARNRHGRVFIPFVPETFQVSSRITTPALTAYQALCTAFQGPPSGDNIDGDGLILSACQPSFKTDTLFDVLNWAVVCDTHTRRDRRRPKRSPVHGAV